MGGDNKGLAPLDSEGRDELHLGPSHWVVNCVVIFGLGWVGRWVVKECLYGFD